MVNPKTKPAMKKTMRYIGMAALALVGTMMMGCAESDLAENQPQGKTVTLTSTITLDGSAATRALDAQGQKTFAVGDKIGLFYKNASDETQFVESEELKKADISSDGKTAKITFDLTGASLKAGNPLRYVYPVYLAKSDVEPAVDIDDENTINTKDRLCVEQDGTLESLANSFDLAVFDGTFTSEATLPASAKLKNRLAIVAFTIEDVGGNDITKSITQLKIDRGPDNFVYVVNCMDAETIYVAMLPTDGATEGAKENLTITATDGTNTYKKEVKDVTLKANSIYPVELAMNRVVVVDL